MSISQDLRHASRLFEREPGSAAIALLAIALGIGATTTLFSVTYGVLLKPLPWPEPDRLVRLEERRGGRTGRVPWTITNGTYVAWRDPSTVDAIGGWMSTSSTFSDAGEPERIRLGRLTPTVFTVLDARALMGRVFDARDAATRPRLARQWLMESVVIGIAGGALGMAGARLLIGLLPAVLPADFPRVSDITLDWRVALASTAATLAAIAVCGLVPTMQARRIDLVQSLADDNLAPVGGGMRTPAARLRATIMAGQIAVACVLLIGAGLLGRSLLSLINVDRGYDPSNLLTARLPLPSGSTYATSAGMLQAISDRLQALPGVTHASFGNALPLVSAGGLSGFTVRLPRDPSTMAKVQTLHRTVAPEYFTAMGLRLRAGRLLADSDTETSQPVLVVNRSFADQYLGDDPIGSRLMLSLYRKVEWEIVGVVDDMKQGGLETAGFVSTADLAQPEMFSSYRQFGEVRPDSVFFVARAAADPSALAPAVRAIVREHAPALVLDSVMTMEDRLMSSLSRPRAYALVLAGVATFALAIAVIGLFGVVSYSVAQRSREIGVRTALGAQTADVVALVLRSGMTITAVGLTAGLAAAALLVKSLSRILYGIGPFDPATFIVVPLVLALAAALACVEPARRAARIDPIRALRPD